MHGIGFAIASFWDGLSLSRKFDADLLYSFAELR